MDYDKNYIEAAYNPEELNEIIKDFERIFDIDLSKKYLKLLEIRKKLDF